jgi:hypothetical protein
MHFEAPRHDSAVSRKLLAAISSTDRATDITTENLIAAASWHAKCHRCAIATPRLALEPGRNIRSGLTTW